MRINTERLMSDLAAINAIGLLEEGGNNRQAFSPADMAGRSLLIERMTEAGLATRIDAAGNIFGRRAAGVPLGAARNGELQPAVLVGSHIDTVARGGRFDGVLGVFGALECIRTLNESDIQIQCPIEIVAFTDEEERFLGFLGSYAFVGEIGYEDIADCTDHEGIRLVDAMRAADFDPEAISAAKVSPEGYRAFLELHIEQGPVLEREKKTIGIVTGVKGNYRWGVTVRGRTDHAGAPLDGRTDAYMALHEVTTRMIAFRNALGDPDTTLTIGRIVAAPNIETAQPGEVTFSVDFRSPQRAFLEAAGTELQATLDDLAVNGGYTVERHPILIEDPLAFDAGIIAAIGDSVAFRGYAARKIYSGAGHDAQVVGRHMPTAMIFVPSVDGRSHCPEEFTCTDDIEAGVNVLLDTLVRLAGGSPPGLERGV